MKILRYNGAKHGLPDQLPGTPTHLHTMQAQLMNYKLNPEHYDEQQYQQSSGPTLQTLTTQYHTTSTYSSTWQHTTTDLKTKTPEKRTLQLSHQPLQHLINITTNNTQQTTKGTSNWYLQQKCQSTLSDDKLRLNTSLMRTTLLFPATSKSTPPTMGAHCITTRMATSMNNPDNMDISAFDIIMDHHAHKPATPTDPTTIPHEFHPNILHIQKKTQRFKCYHSKTNAYKEDPHWCSGNRAS